MAEPNKNAPQETKTKKGAAPPTDTSFKGKIWNPILRPVVALTIICLVTSFLLGLTNQITLPLIEENNRITTENARKELLPEADGFEEVVLEKEYSNIISMYQATNGAGYIIQASAPGYGGQVPAMIAFDPEGNIAGVKFLENNETPGLGKKINTEAWFNEQFIGLPLAPITGNEPEIDQIASATITSNAVYTSINAAITLYADVVQGGSIEAVAGATQGGEGADGSYAQQTEDSTKGAEVDG